MEHQPWRRPLMMFLTVVIGVGGMLLGFALGDRQVITDHIARTELQSTVAELRQSTEQLEAQLIDARLNEEVQRTATNALRQDLTTSHQNIARLQEEVTFYKGLMAPSSLSKGLQVAELELVAGEAADVYGYQLLLTQVAVRRSFISGEVRLDVVGGYAGEDESSEAVLSLTELSDTKTYPLKFRFRYFQDLAGRITLPAGFTPERVLVTANQSGKEPLQVTFPWPAS